MTVLGSSSQATTLIRAFIRLLCLMPSDSVIMPSDLVIMPSDSIAENP